MKQIILVRYGQWEHEHLSPQGRVTMELSAERLKIFLGNRVAMVIAAEVPRAIESAQIIAKHLKISEVSSFSELYAAEECEKLPDPILAEQIINRQFSDEREPEIIIAVVSREHIETLPSYITKNIFALEEDVQVSLDR